MGPEFKGGRADTKDYKLEISSHYLNISDTWPMYTKSLIGNHSEKGARVNIYGWLIQWITTYTIQSKIELNLLLNYHGRLLIVAAVSITVTSLVVIVVVVV